MSLIELHRSTRAACEHRAFVLKAVGIPSEIVNLEGLFVLFVPEEAIERANEQLDLYYAENAPANKVPIEFKSRSDAWLAPLLFGFCLLAIGFMAGRNDFGADWYRNGALTRAVFSEHEWWRSITALTLHADHQHLLGNLGFGGLFVFVAARLLGAGVAMLSVVVAAMFGNLVDAYLMPSHISIGASTMVFASLGLVSAYSWRIQFSTRMRWAHRWAPLVVGVMLLGFLGTSGENTDVLAHLTGFFFGAVFGSTLARLPTAFFDRAKPQILCCTIALALLLGTWGFALK